MRRQISFNACDQVWNADRLGQKWMSLDLQGDLASAFVTRAVRKTTVFGTISGRGQFVRPPSLPRTSGIAISLDRKFTRRFSTQLVSVSRRTGNKANPKRRGARTS